MNILRSKVSVLRFSLMVASAFLAVGQARAQSIWSDATSDNKISTNGNWSTPPGPGADVEFDGAGNQNILFDVPSYTLNSVTFNGSNSYVFGPSSTSNVLTILSSISSNATGGINVTVNVALGGDITVTNENSTLTMGGIISGAHNVGIYGESTVVLTGANTYSGMTTINSGAALQIGNGVIMGAALAGDVTDNGSLVFQPASSDVYQYSHNIGGSGTLQVYGAGKLVLSGINRYGGNTYVDNGILADGAAGSFSPNSDIIVNSTGGSVQVNYNESIGSLQNGNAGGPVSIASGATLTSYGDSNPGDFMGVISGLGSIVIDGGSQGFAGNNTFSGGVHVTNGEIFIGSNNALGTGTLTLDAGTEFSPSANNLTLTNPITLNGTGYIENEDGGSYNMSLNGPISGGGTLEWCTPGVLTLNNAGSVFSGGVDIRQGTVNLIVTGAAGTGTIYIDSGSRLLISSGVTVANPLTFTGSAGSIAGNGVISSSVAANGGIVLNPSSSNGNGAGILSFTSGLTFQTGSAFHFNLLDATGAAGTGYSEIATNQAYFTANPNTITFNLVSTDSSGNSVAALNFNSANSYSWTILTSTNPITGFNSNMFHLDTSGFVNSTGTGQFYFDKIGNTVVLDFNPVPEPSTWALMGLGLLALIPVGLRLRRQARA